MTKHLKFIIPFIIFLGIAGFLWKGLTLNPREIPSALIGKPVPAFDLQALNNANETETNKIFKGHVSLLNIWASWCVSCRAEHGVLMEIARSHKVQMIGLNYKDHRTAALKWLKTLGNPYNLSIYDPKGQLAMNLGVYGTPETFIIDQKGIIRDKIVGPISPQAWEDKVLPEIEKLQHKVIQQYRR